MFTFYYNNYYAENQSSGKQAIQAAAHAFLYKMIITVVEKTCLSTLMYGQLGDTG